jgi:hypothetical protein
LQAKVEELEKEKEKFAQRLADEKKSYEVKFKDGFNKLLEQKQIEIDKLTRELRKSKELIN